MTAADAARRDARPVPPTDGTPPAPPAGPPAGRPRHRRALVACGAVGLVLVGLVAVLATRSVAPGTVETSNLGGKVAPAVAGRNLLTGAPVSLAGERGKFVLVDFFASWCAACQSEAPAIEQFLFTHRAAGDVAVIGVDSTTDTTGDAAAFLRRTGATFPAITDPGGQIAVHYGVASPPQSFLVGPSGKVVAWIPGGVTAAALDALVPAGAVR